MDKYVLRIYNIYVIYVHVILPFIRFLKNLFIVLLSFIFILFFINFFFFILVSSSGDYTEVFRGTRPFFSFQGGGLKPLWPLGDPSRNPSFYLSRAGVYTPLSLLSLFFSFFGFLFCSV